MDLLKSLTEIQFQETLSRFQSFIRYRKTGVLKLLTTFFNWCFVGKSIFLEHLKENYLECRL